MTLAQLPKVELHLRLDCGLSYEVVSKIDPYIIKEAYDIEYIGPAKCFNLADFLTRAVKGFALMQTKKQLQLVVHDLFKQLVVNNVLYAEITFAPLQHLEKGLTPVEMVAATEEVMATAVKQTGVRQGYYYAPFAIFPQPKVRKRLSWFSSLKAVMLAVLISLQMRRVFPSQITLRHFNLPINIKFAVQPMQAKQKDRKACGKLCSILDHHASGMV